MIPIHSSSRFEPGREEDDEPERPAEIDADDQRLSADPVGQPAGDDRHRHREHDERAVHQPGRPFVEADDPGHVEQREQVDDAETAPAAAERGGQVQPEQVAVVEDPSEGRADRPARDGGRPVRAALADEQEDEDPDRDGRQPEHDRCARASRPPR